MYRKSSKTKSKTGKTVYDIVTEKITTLLEAGHIPWQKPWKMSDAPKNFVSHRRYSGVNVFMLTAVREIKGYTSTEWLTQNQVNDLGGYVDWAKEKRTLIIKAATFDKKVAEGAKPETGFSMIYYQVYNSDQVTGLPLHLKYPEVIIDPITAAELVYTNMPGRPEIKTGGDRASYVPRLDYVKMPTRNSFKSAEYYYKTLWHELAHSTSNASRLNRDVGAHVFGSQDYSREELVAEMSAAFMMGATGIENDDTITNSTGYIKSWLTALASDSHLVVSAASQAQKVADYILCIKEEAPDVTDRPSK